MFNSLINTLCKKQTFYRISVRISTWLLCVTQLFDCNPRVDMRGIFLNTSKAFDKVWHKGLIFKLISYRIAGDLLKLSINYLECYKKRIILNEKPCSRRNTLAGLPQGSVLGRNFIPDLPDGINSISK